MPLSIAVRRLLEEELQLREYRFLNFPVRLAMCGERERERKKAGHLCYPWPPRYQGFFFCLFEPNVTGVVMFACVLVSTNAIPKYHKD